MFPVSTRFLTALNKPHVAVSKVEIRNNGILIQDISGYLQSGGSVSVDETRQVRRTCSLTLAGLPLGMIPETETDLFHPVSGNELYIYRGIRYSDGTTEFAQLGVFRMTKPVVKDDGDSVTLAISGQDRSSVISRISWQQPYSIAAGTNLGTALKTAMASRWPASAAPLQYNFAPTTVVVPATVWGANPGQANDPMADMIKLAADAAGMELLFDFLGNPTLRPISDPTQSTVVAKYVEGVDCNLTELTRTLDETQTFNGVSVYCNGTGPAGPFVVFVWDTNSASATYYLGNWGQVPYPIVTTAIPGPTQSLVDATAQATAIGQARLQLILGAFDATDFESLPNPALAEGDCLTLMRTRIKVNANYVASAMTIPLDPESAEQITNRPQLAA